MEEAKNEQLLILNHVIINSRLYSITTSTSNQHEQMPTEASQTSCERQGKNPLYQSCPLLTDDAVAALAATLSHPPSYGRPLWTYHADVNA